ncbi:MAG: hypothetical protein L6R28_21945 [Planctomycetes bacterium]|nr:hypothetical protein [Planctomycetota bacterium]
MGYSEYEREYEQYKKELALYEAIYSKLDGYQEALKTGDFDNVKLPPMPDDSDGEETSERPPADSGKSNAHLPPKFGKIEKEKVGLAANASMGFREDSGNVVRGPQSGLAGGANAQHIERDPKQDLAQWFRSFMYHEEMAPADYSDKAEDAIGLSVADAGPAPASGLYGRLRGFLPRDGTESPPPVQMLSALEALWKNRWRSALDFDADPFNKQLLTDADYARKLSAASEKRLNDLKRSAGKDPDAGARLKAALASAKRELDAARAKEKECSDTLFRRLQFVQAMVELLRLAPDGGFGPEFESADLEAVQRSAARILAELGALAGAVTWQGLSEDLAWLDEHHSDRNSLEYARRVRGMNACEALLADPRVEGLAAVCDFLASSKPASADLLRKAFELVDRFGTGSLRAEVLNVLPRLLELAGAKDSGVAGRARHLVLRMLKVRSGGASMEAAIGTLAPLTASKDAELARAALDFLQGNTGMAFGAEPRKWQALQAEMKQKRLAGK